MSKTEKSDQWYALDKEIRDSGHENPNVLKAFSDLEAAGNRDKQTNEMSVSELLAIRALIREIVSARRERLKEELAKIELLG